MMTCQASFLRSWILTAALVLAQQCHAADEREQNSNASVHPSALLLAKATVLQRDGHPAAAAVVHSYDNNLDMSRRTVTADSLGRIRLQDAFLGGLLLHALSADGRSQAVLMLPAAATRSLVSQPLTIRLEPAVPHQVVVTANGKLLEGARVAVVGIVSRSTGITQSDGTCVVWRPAGEQIKSVVAWHAEHGLNGLRDRGSAKFGMRTELALLPPAPHVIRVLDDRGNPVAGLTISAKLRLTEGDWLITRDFAPARAKTGDNGEARFEWFPSNGIKYVGVDFVDKGWKQDEVDYEKIPDGLTTVHVRKEYRVQGRIVLPTGVDAHGLKITGFGFGLGSTGDIPRTRTRKDGTFSMDVSAGHGYVIGVSDLYWSSNIWSDVMLPIAGERQKEIVLQGYAATPIEISVARGSSWEPIAEAWVQVSRRGEIEWTDETGESRSGSAGIRGWLRTDKNGRASTGIGRGKVELRLSSGDWAVTKIIEVTSPEPIKVEFHRAWIGKRVLTARPTATSAYVPSTDAVALAWTERSPQVDKIHTPSIMENGTVKLEFDEEDVAVLLLDHKQQVSGFARAGVDDVVVDLSVRPNATYRGRLVDRKDGSPLADRTVRMITDSSFLDVVEPQQTDAMGRFEFTSVPASVPLRLSVKNERDQPEYFLFSGVRLFLPGENRTGDVAKASLMDGDTAVPNEPLERSLTQRIASAAANCRVMGMQTIVILEGDQSKRVKLVAGSLCDDDEVPAIRRFLPVAVTATQQNADSQWLAAKDWPRPKAGEVMLVVMADSKAASATLPLTCTDVEAAVERGVQFIQQHMPATRDGRTKLANARTEARASNRTVWVIVGGPRCGPCFRLARWIDRHHHVLEKDLVIVKLTGGLDEHANEIGDEIGGGRHGIPFHALMSPEGDVLLTSEGPLGNIGMPGSIEGIRHFQSMLEAVRKNMTSADVRQLVESLKKQRD